MIDTEEARIIARDGGRIDAADCRLIADMADELDAFRQALLATQAQLIDNQRQLIATRDVLLRFVRNPPFTPAIWTAQIVWKPES